MKVTKIMTDLLKLVEKKKTTTCNYGMDENYIYFTPDGYRIFKIYKPLFLIDLKKALPNKIPFVNPSNFFKADNCEDGKKTGEMRVIDDWKETIIKIESEHSHAWVNEKYLKEFDRDCSFKIGTPKQPVLIYEHDEVVGVVCPVNLKEDRNNDQIRKYGGI